ncbi:MAG: CGNR zinc finger domain-containing protein [Ilumatobacteraceae bacterium]|nr:CGNR zinc finger domain-containing protein [Ilumatobacteraceae bacterium]
MAAGHPVDARGRTLPDSAWPADRHAPRGLEFVRRFCNTTNLESGADRLADVDDFDDWLRAQGRAAIAATMAERARLAEVRELVRDATIAHRDGEPDDEATTALARRCASVSFRFGPRGDGVPMQAAAAPGTTEHLVAQVLLGIADAVDDGTWYRLKACAHCRWVVYDTSKNRSMRWCSMSACGGRSKVRRHRERRRPV